MNDPFLGVSAQRSPGMATSITPEIAAEAALWVSRLHGPDRTPAMEQEFHRWEATSPAHREAFGRCTDVWMELPQIKVADAYSAAASAHVAQERAARYRPTRRRLVTAGLALVLAAGAIVLTRRQEEGTYTTAVGEQRLIVLTDGTRVLMNTQTRIRVDYREALRRVIVDGGEALFEVAKDASRPFVVRAGGSEVVAVGTVFTVRWMDGSSKDPALAVTLVEGQVNVRESEQYRAGELAPVKMLTLRPGDRLLLNRPVAEGGTQANAKLDRPDIDQVVAWKRREAVFQDSLLEDAVREMNRYSRTKLVLSDDLLAADLHVSGVFRTGDSASFAHAVAALHGLQVQERNGRLELKKFR